MKNRIFSSKTESNYRIDYWIIWNIDKDNARTRVSKEEKH